MRLTWEVSGGDRHLKFYEARDNLGLGAEEVRDLPAHSARGLGRAFTLEERPNAVADPLLGALNRAGVLRWLGSQVDRTS